ncbi:MAG: TolC family protein [Muribaculaceae bacterium]|nr:TolC family protein [Muribaculaceae bacterium]
MKNILRLGAATLTIVSSLSLWGASPTTVSLDSCRHLALANNKTIMIAREGINTAEFNKKAAKAAYLPGIDFSGGYMYNQNIISLLGENAKLPTMSFDAASGSYKPNILVGPDGIPVKDPATGSYIPTEVAVIPKEAMEYDVHNVFAGAFTLTQPIFMGGRIKALNDIAAHAESAARSGHEKVVQDVTYKVDEAYWLVVSLKAKEKLADSFVALMDSLKLNVDHLLENGMATRSDVLNVEVKLNEAQIARTKVSNGLSLSRMALAQTCGLPIDTQMTLEDEDLKSCNADTYSLPQDFNMADIYARRQDLEVIRQSINMLKGTEKLAMADMLPTIAAVGMYSFSNPNVKNGFEKKFGGGFSVGAMLTVPLWHWGGNYNKYRAAKSATNAQRLLLEDAEEMVNLQVNQAKFKYSEAFKTLDMTRTNMKKADENLRQAQLAFREGVLTADDVIAAQTAWLQAHSELIDAEIGIRLCDVYLSKVTGNL